MNQCGINEGLSEPFVTMVMDGLRVDGWSGRRRAAMQLEALRKNYEFYNRYGGFMDVLEAIALFSNCCADVSMPRAERMADTYLTEAGWRKDCIDLVKLGIYKLRDMKDPMYNKLDGNMRPLRAGLMVMRDVWFVPQFLPYTRKHACDMRLRDIEYDLLCPGDTSEQLRGQAWTVRQDWLKDVLGHLEDGSWPSLGWSCVYESALEAAGDEKALVKDLIHEDMRDVPLSKCVQTV